MKNWKKIIKAALVIVVLMWLAYMLFLVWDVIRTPKVERVEVHDTTYIEKRDTFPVIKTERVVKYISLPCADSVCHELQPDSTMPLAVIQRTYSDDSTYTAYVSGVQVEEYPRLDSISVIQRTITNIIYQNTIVEKKRRITYGLQVGAGYGVISKKPDIFVGIGVQFNL